MHHLISTVPLFSLLFSAIPAYGQPAFAPPEKKPPNPSISLPSHLVIQPPNGWTSLPGLSETIALTAQQTEYFEDEQTLSGAIAFGRASRGALYITWVQSEQVLINPEITIRQALDNLHQAPYLANVPGSTQEISYRERVFGFMNEMTWEWIHGENATINIVRVLAWQDEQSHVHLEIAECLLPRDGDDSESSRRLCETALASMQLNESAKPAPLGTLSPPRSVSTFSPDTLTVPKLEIGDLRGGSSLDIPPQQLGEILYQGKKPAQESEDKTHRIFIGIGIALLGLAIWLTTRDGPNAPKKTWAKDDPKPDPEAIPNDTNSTGESEKKETTE